MPTRRQFLRTATVGATAATVLPALATAAATPTAGSSLSTPTTTSAPSVDITAREAVLTGHRNLFNGDTCVYFYNPEKWQPEGGAFSTKVIHRYVDTLADNGIDTFVINANASRAWYPSKTIPTILDGYRRGDREYFRGHAICAGATEPAAVEKYIDTIMAFMNRYQDLLDAGVDWLAETAVACRRRAVSPWVSVRMNDMHGHLNYAGSFFNAPLLKDPAMRLHHSAYSPTMRLPDYRSGLNYEKPEVRAFIFAQIKEVVEDYDFAGLELDWWRNALCCEPNATPETTAMMTDWFRQIRALTRRRAEKTGRAYPFGFRIPGRLEALKNIGLDIVTLCREGIIDFVCVSNFWRTSWDMPHDELRRQLGDRVAIYGGIEAGANRLATFSPAANVTREVRLIGGSREMLHANAAGKLVLGADGIEWYNFFCTDQPTLPGVVCDYTALRDIHKLDLLRGQPKHYTFSDKGGTLEQIPFDQPTPLPVVLERGWMQSFRLPMCAEPTDRNLELVVQVVLKKTDTFARLPVAVNGTWPLLKHTTSEKLLFPSGSFTDHSAAHLGYNFRFPISLLRDGWNEITVENGGDQTITVVALELAVRSVAS
ncbi:MAG: hypothetical protein H7343_03310 [Undibacterium sp.]|nr:hypothetical protein [Opitutaceae bacterium]